MMNNNTNEHYYQKKDKEQAEIALAKAKKLGRKVRFLKQGESPEYEKIKAELRSLPKRKRRTSKLEDKKDIIKQYLSEGKTLLFISKELNVNTSYLHHFIKKQNLIQWKNRFSK